MTTTSTYHIDLNKLCPNCGKTGAIVERADSLCRQCVLDLMNDDLQAIHPAAHISPSPAEGEGYGEGELQRYRRGLSGTLLSLIVRAEKAHDNKFHSLPVLTGGLNIEVGLGAAFNFRIWRKDCTPSATEWRTCVDHLPAAYKPAVVVLPRDFKNTERDGHVRWYLEGHWPFNQTRK